MNQRAWRLRIVAMTPFIPARARQRAADDWNNRAALHLVVGRNDPSHPDYRYTSLFYTEAIALESGGEAEAYCQIYNETIQSFLLKWGIPEWAPARRLPEPWLCLQRLGCHGRAFAEYAPYGEEQALLAQVLLALWPVPPQRWALMEDANVVLWAGTLPDGSLRMDVIDLLFGTRWMASYTCTREEYPRFPWEAPALLSQ